MALALDVIILSMSDIDLWTQLCVMRWGVSVGDPCLMPEHDKVRATTWLIFQESSLPSDSQPAGRVCPRILNSLQRSASTDEQSNYVVWITPRCGAWIDSKVTVCRETSAYYCEMFLSPSVSQPQCDCFVTEGNLQEWNAILGWLETGKYWLQMPRLLCWEQW